MAYPQHAVKFVLNGKVPSGEVFAHSQWFDGTASDTDDDARSLASGLLAADWLTNFLTTTVKSYFANTVSWVGWNAYWYAGGPAAAHSYGADYVTPAVGTGGTSVLPAQMCTVMSQRTGRPGRSYRGRAYLPGVVPSQVTTTGLVTGTLAQDLATAYADWLSTVKADAGHMIGVVASSRLSAMTPITQVSVDTRLDVQRTRANKLSGVMRFAADVS